MNYLHHFTALSINSLLLHAIPISISMLVLAGIELTVSQYLVWIIFWICAGNNVDNTAMFSFQLSSTCTVKASSTPHPTPPARRLGLHTVLGEEIAGTAIS